MAIPKNINKKKLDVFWKTTWNHVWKFRVPLEANFETEGMTYLWVCLITNQHSKTKMTEDMKTAERMLASFKYSFTYLEFLRIPKMFKKPCQSFDKYFIAISVYYTLVLMRLFFKQFKQTIMSFSLTSTHTMRLLKDCYALYTFKKSVTKYKKVFILFKKVTICVVIQRKNTIPPLGDCR